MVHIIILLLHDGNGRFWVVNFAFHLVYIINKLVDGEKDSLNVVTMSVCGEGILFLWYSPSHIKPMC